MKVSGFWTAVGFVIAGLIIADLVTHPSGTAAVSKGITGVTGSTTSALIGK